MKKIVKRKTSINLCEKEFNYFAIKAEMNINSSNCPQEFISIIAIFAEDCDFNLTKIYSSMFRLFIEGESDNGCNSLLLRYYDNNLIIAQIKFINCRHGNMTRLYKILKRLQNKHKLNKIIIENCYTIAITNWCIKNNFVVDNSNSYIEK